MGGGMGMGGGGGFLRSAAATAAGVAGGALLFEGISSMFGHNYSSGLMGGGVGTAECNALGFGAFRVYGDAAGGGSISPRIREIDRRLVSRHQPAVRIGGRCA